MARRQSAFDDIGRRQSSVATVISRQPSKLKSPLASDASSSAGTGISRLLSAGPSINKSRPRSLQLEVPSTRPPVRSSPGGGSNDRQGRRQGNRTEGFSERERDYLNAVVNSPSSANFNDAESIAAEISAWPLFAGCERGFIEEMSYGAVPRIQDLEIFQEVHRGDIGPSMVWVRKGMLTAQYKEFELLHMKPGVYFGESALLGIEQDWAVSLRASMPTRIGFISRDDFLQACHMYPSVDEWFQHKTLASVHNDLYGRLQEVAILHGLSEACLMSMESCMITRVAMRNEEIIQQGDPGEEMYLLMNGSIDVEINGSRVATLSVSAGEAPPCFGELGMLGKQLMRSATIRAVGLCVIRVLCRPVFVAKLQDFNESIMVRQASQGDSANTRSDRRRWFQDVDVFCTARCSDVFINFLEQHLEQRMFVSGQTIIDEEGGGAKQRSMYMLSQGSVKVKKKGKTVNILSAGAVFGELVTFGVVSKPTATIVAQELCFVDVLHLAIILRGLAMCPDDRTNVMEAARAFTSGHERNASKKHSTGVNMSHILQKNSFFEKTGKEFMDRLSRVAVVRLFLPEEMIITEGEKGRSMFIMGKGKAGLWITSKEKDPSTKAETGKTSIAEFDLRKMTRINEVSSGDVIGELAMLGVVATRSASIRAESLCTIWEISQDASFDILFGFPAVQSKFAAVISSHLEDTVSHRLTFLPMFNAFDARWRMQIVSQCRGKVYFPRHVVLREDKELQGLYIINRGLAGVHKKDVDVKRLEPGQCYGATTMLGIHSVSLATIKAVEVCHVISLSRESFEQANLEYGDVGSLEAIKRVESAAYSDLADECQKAVKRHSVKMLIQDNLLPYIGSPIDDPGDPLYERIFRAWNKLTKMEHLHRRREAERERQQAQSTELYYEWLARQHTARERRSAKQQIIVSMDCERSVAADSRSFAWSKCTPIPGALPSWLTSPGMIKPAASPLCSSGPRPGTSGRPGSSSWRPSAASSPASSRPRRVGGPPSSTCVLATTLGTPRMLPDIPLSARRVVVTS